MTQKKKAGRKDPAYKDFVSRQTCCTKGCNRPSGPPHHYRTAANSGTGIKPDDTWCLPFCVEHHEELHQHGIETFFLKHWGFRNRFLINDMVAIIRAPLLDEWHWYMYEVING